MKVKKNSVIAVQPIKPIENHGSDNENNIESEHLATYRNIWKLIDLLASMVGISAYKEVEMNFMFIFTSSVICFAFPSLFYTMIVVWPSVSTLLEVICIFGVLLPVTNLNIKS